jgi:hypothetical protein
MTTQPPAGTIVRIDKFLTAPGVTWTVVGPTRHHYAVVVRESQFNTTVHVNLSEIEVA